MSLEDQYKRILANIQSSQKPIEVVAVSKGQPLSKILQLYQVGQRLFGESRVVEALQKMQEAPKDISWHFIGHLQKNKVSRVVGHFALIHSVDSIELAEKISFCCTERGIVQPVLLQFNCSAESTKGGFLPEEADEVFQKIQLLPGILIKGLMTMAPNTKDEQMIRSTFATLRKMREKCRVEGLKYLSMGMSQDYLIAIQEGANLLRIGSAFFEEGWN